MVVNTGTVKFGEFDQNGDPKVEPDRKWSMESLLRYAFERDISEDKKTNTIKRTHVQSYLIEKKLDQVFLRTGKNRMLESEYSGEELFEFNPFEDYEVSLAARNSFLDSLNKNASMKSAMRSISLLKESKWKKALLCYLMHQGIHIKNKDFFKLNSKFSDEEVSDYSKDDISAIIVENSMFNEIITNYIKTYEKDYELLVKEFLDKVKSFANEGFEDELLLNVKNNLSKFLDVNETVANLWRDIYGNGTDSYRGWRSESGSDELLLNPSSKSEFKSLLTDRENGLRKRLNDLMKIPLTSLRKSFELRPNDYKNAVADALFWLQQLYGYSV